MAGRVRVAFVILALFALTNLWAQEPPKNNIRLETLESLSAFKEALPEKQNFKYRFDEKDFSVRSLLGFKTNPEPLRDAQDVARDFLKKNQRLFRVSDQTEFSLDREHRGDQRKDLLFKIKHRGIPVEFSKISVHASDKNEIQAAFSSWESVLDSLEPTPKISEVQARSVVESQWAKMSLAEVPGGLVYLPAKFDGEPHLAWKFRYRSSAPRRGLWSAYVDAHSGKFLGAINELRSVGIVVQAPRWQRDPSELNLTSAPIRGILGWTQPAGGLPTPIGPSGGDGALTVSNTPGDSFYAALRTTYSVVVDYAGNNPVITYGTSNWLPVSISSISVSPYPLSVSNTQTFTCPTPAIFSALRFNFFDVGYQAKAVNESDDFDFVEVLQPGGGSAGGTRLAVYTGDNRSPFVSFPSTGTQIALRLASNATNGQGNEGGYQVNIASCLIQTAALNGPAAEGTLVTATVTTPSAIGLTTILKHLDDVHLFLTSGEPTVGPKTFNGGARWANVLKEPVVAHANFSVNSADTFFDPDLNGIFFGGTNITGTSNRNTALAADVIMHEYVHWAVDKVYELPNFGQSGAVSEAVADFLAINTYNTLYRFGLLGAKSTFGEWAFPPSTGSAADCGKTTELCRQLNQSPPKKYPNDWVGEIHDDSQILSGALMDLSNGVGALSPSTRGLVKEALFFFPDSFESFYEAMILVSSGVFDGAITTAFNAHGIGTWNIAGSDALEPNDAFQTARSLASGAKTTASVFPAGDVDMYRFTAGVGPVTLTLNRPFDSSALMYLAYGFQVFDVARKALASTLPANVFNFTGNTNSYVSDKTAQASLTLSQPQVLYVAVSAPLTADGNNDPSKSSSLSYDLTASFNTPINAVTAAQISAEIADQRRIRFTATSLTGFASDQMSEVVLDHVDVRDHSLTRLASVSNLTPGNQVTLTSQNPGSIIATAELPANFFDLYPSIGSLYIEPFVKNPLGRIYSIGLSNEIKIFSDQATFVAYNNIFDPSKSQKTTFKYQAASSGRYRVVVYTMAGDLVRILVDRDEAAGIGSVDWDGKNGAGDTVASGIYLVHFDGPGIKNTRKVAVVK